MWTVPAIAGLEHGGDDVIERVSLIDQGATEAATTPSAAPSSFVAGLLAALTASAAGTTTASASSAPAAATTSPSASPTAGARTPAKGPVRVTASAAAAVLALPTSGTGPGTGVPHTIDSAAAAISWIPGGAIAAAATAGAPAAAGGAAMSDPPVPGVGTNGTVATDEPPVPTVPSQSSSSPVPGRDGTWSPAAGRRRMTVRLLVDAPGAGDADGSRVDVGTPPVGHAAIESMPAGVTATPAASTAQAAERTAAASVGVRTLAGPAPTAHRAAHPNTLRVADEPLATPDPLAAPAGSADGASVTDPSLTALVADADAPAAGRAARAGSNERHALDDITAAVGRDLDPATSNVQPAQSGWSAISRAASASATSPTSTTAATPATTPSTSAPKASIGMANVDRVRFARESAPAREIQRLAIDLDGARVAVRVDAHRMSVDVVSDPAGELGNGWAKHVEKSLDQAVRAGSTPGSQGEGQTDGRGANPHGSTRGQAEANDRREQHRATIDGSVDEATRANRWAAATAQLIGTSS